MRWYVRTACTAFYWPQASNPKPRVTLNASHKGQSAVTLHTYAVQVVDGVGFYLSWAGFMSTIRVTGILQRMLVSNALYLGKCRGWSLSRAGWDVQLGAVECKGSWWRQVPMPPAAVVSRQCRFHT